MLNFLMPDSPPPSIQEIAFAFRRWGRIGFWLPKN
ncbi:MULTISPECIES: DUF3611 family protein [Okeania]|nr:MULTISPECIES: DUF3611 family protein [Okeania]